MEISTVFTSAFQHIPITPLPIFSSSFSPLSSSTITPVNNNNSQFSASAIATNFRPTETQSEPSNVSAKSSPKLVPVQSKTRQSAILDIQDSSDLVSALARSGKILRVQDLNVILRHFGNLSRWKEISQLFDWMQQNEKTNIASYSSYIKFMGKSLNPVKALEIYKSIKDEQTRNNVSVCNSILSCLVKNGRFASSLKMFYQMKQDGLKPDIVTYSTLLVGCVKDKDGYSKALQLVQELKYNGLQMDLVIYGTLLSVCASNNQCKEAERYFAEMKSEGHSPNVFHYSSLLNAYSVNGNYEKADVLVQEMKSAGLVPNKVSLTTLLKVYVRGGLFEKSRELLNELETLGYAEMRWLCAYSIMISAFCRSGLIEDAKQLASFFEAKYDKYDVVILNTILCAYSRAGDMDNVMKMLKKMDKLAIGPDWNTFPILIKYFCRESLYTLAYKTMEDMHKRGHLLEEGLCSTLMHQLGKSGAYREAFSVYNMLKYNKRTMSKALHEKVLNILVTGRLLKDAYVVVKDNAGLISQPAIKKFATSFMESGNINLINDVIKAIHSSGHKIDQESFRMAISRYLEQPEKKDLLFQLLQWMPGQGYFVDSSARNLILKKSHLFGRQTIAELLSKQHMLSKAKNSRKTRIN